MDKYFSIQNANINVAHHNNSRISQTCANYIVESIIYQLISYVYFSN